MAEAEEKVFYVYAHFRADAYPYNPDADPCDPSGGIFYIGKGTVCDRFKSVKRHRTVCGRTPFWNNVSRKHGFVSVVLFDTKDEAEAYLWERRFISFLGKRRNGTGPLVNLAEGGEGAPGMVHSKETRAKMAQAKRGRKITGEALERKRKASKATFGKPVVDTTTREYWLSATDAAKARGLKVRVVTGWLADQRPNPTSLRYVNSLFVVAKVRLPRARPRTPEQRARIATAIVRAHGRAVVNTETGQIWKCQGEAADANGVNRGTMNSRLIGKVRNKTPFRYLDEVASRESSPAVQP